MTRYREDMEEQMYSNTTAVMPAHRQASVSLLRSASRRGVTLVELLAVVAIVGVVTGMLLPAVQKSRESARRGTCSNHLRQLALASVKYEEAHKTLPVGSHNSHWTTWMVQLMPHLEQQAFYDAYDRDLYTTESRFDRGGNAKLTQEFFSEFACPNQPPVRTTFGGASAHSYAACTGNGAYVSTPAGWNTNPPVSITPLGTYQIAAVLGTSEFNNATITVSANSFSGNISAVGGLVAGVVRGQHIVVGNVAHIQSITTGLLEPVGEAGAPAGGAAPTHITVPPAMPLIFPFFLLRGPEGGPVSPITISQSANGSFSAFKAFGGGAYQMSGGSTALTPAEDQELLRKAIAVRLAEITDGLSNTLAFSEVLRAETHAGAEVSDYRGLSWWGPGALFSTLAPPNSQLPDVMPRKGDCNSDPSAPCQCPHTSANPIRVLARSRHPGGVVAATCDGAVEFRSNYIDATVWENLGTTQGDLPQ